MSPPITRTSALKATFARAPRADGGLAQPQPLDNGGTVRVALSKTPQKNPSYDSRSMDQRILEIALEVRDDAPETRTILVTKDVNMRVRGDALGLHCVDYEPERISIDDLYPGNREVNVEPGAIDALYAEGGATVELEGGLYPNEYVLLKDEASGKSALGKYDKTTARVQPVKKLRDGVWGIRPRNKEQHYALDLLLNDDIKLVTLVGKAGTGKTLVAIAAGLQKVVEETGYQKLLVSRPVYPLGRDIGLLPGDIEEKLNPWMQPIFDNVEFLMGLTQKDKKRGRSYRELLDMGMMQIEPLTYIRGRSIPNQYMIVDEAQNLTPHEVKTIISRAGENTKIVLTGDPYQIDNPYVDQTNNGLVHTVNRFRTEKIAAHVTLVKGDLRGIVRARRLSRATMQNIRQNLFFAFAYNALGVPVAAGVLYPALGVLLSPMIAAAAMSLSSVSVIGNALRLRGRSL